VKLQGCEESQNIQNLQSGEEYVETPAIPPLEPTINGKFTGTLIHATTNPKSLGKTYSLSCIVTSEPHIWSIYHYCARLVRK
jgi:hypothetical protein